MSLDLLYSQYRHHLLCNFSRNPQPCRQCISMESKHPSRAHISVWFK